MVLYHHLTLVIRMLVDLYKTNPGSLLTAQLTDFDQGQWQDLAHHLCRSPSDPYDLHVVCHILSLIGHQEIFDDITVAAYFFHTAIVQEDIQTVDFILDHFENLDAQQDKNPDFPSYLEAAVDNINAGHDQCHMVLERLLTQFSDRGGALMSAVRWGNCNVVSKLLPHSDPSFDFCLPYRWAQVYNFHDIENILEPLSNKIYALFGYTLARWYEPEDQNIAQKRELVLRERIEKNAFNEPLTLLYTRGLNNQLSVHEFKTLSSKDVYVLTMLWKNKCLDNAHTALKSVACFKDNHAHDLIKHFRSASEIIVPRLSAKAQQRILVECAFNTDRCLADCLFAHGVEVHQALERLGNPSSLLKMRTVPAIARNLEKRKAACEVLGQWINEWQAQTILEEIDGEGALKTPSKI